MRCRWLFLACVSYPALLISSLYVTWFVARLSLGRWPRPYLDDPKYINGIGIPYGITGFLLVTMPAVALASVGFAGWLYCKRDPQARTPMLYAVATILGAVAAVVVLRWDPFQVADWYMD